MTYIHRSSLLRFAIQKILYISIWELVYSDFHLSFRIFQFVACQYTCVLTKNTVSLDQDKMLVF
jgi:hypothetical protein